MRVFVMRVFVLLALLLTGALASAPPEPGWGREDCRVLEDFATARVGEFPQGWRAREDEGRTVYSVGEERGRRFLRAHARELGIQAAKEYEWPLEAYPILAWSWRVREFPQGADEKDGKNDSAVAVYMLVPHSPVRGPRAVKYIWSERVSAGTHLESNGGLTQVRVLRTGAGKRGDWVEERVNVRDDFRKYFRQEDVPRPAGIAVLTDADDTRSSAQGDYANFRICRG